MKKTGIIGAMQVEVQGLKDAMTEVKVVKKASMDFYDGVLNGKPVVVVQCGVGKVNAAICTQVLVDDFNVDLVINTGVAGSLDAQIDIGDIVVSTDAVHHDMDVTPLGYKKGQVPGLEYYSFEADQELVAKVKEVCARVNPDIKIWSGRVCSGDQFIASDDVKAAIIQNFSGMCTEMEGASIAHTCTLNGVPFVIIRAISDKADGSGSVDYPTFEAASAVRCLKLTQALIAEM